METILLLVIISIVVSGVELFLTYRDKVKHPPPGMLIDIGECRLHLLCMGDEHEAPSVILESGSLGFSAKWDTVQRAVSSFARVYSYDRAGYGWSDTVKSSRSDRSGQRIIKELHTLLANAHVPKPYILVGHDIGGQYVRQFACRYPELVAGLVLVDSFHPFQWSGRATWVQEIRSTRMMSFFALVRLENWLRYRRFALSNSAKAASIALHERGLQVSASWEVISLEPEEVYDGILDDKPVVVLTQTLAGKPYGETWGLAQKDFLRLSSNSHLLTAEHSGHLIHLEEPNLVVKGIQQVVEAVRSKPISST